MPDSVQDPFWRLVRIMERLQEPGGCPWDIKQTHESLKQYLLEESYEVFDAIDRGDMADLEEELGDVLLQVIFHSVLAARTSGAFTMHDVIETSAAKMIHRHPHVFGETEARTAEDVLHNWEKLKEQERARKAEASKESEPASLLASIPAHLPALLKAQRMQEKAARVGFDWEETAPVLDKIEEEIREFREAVSAGNQEHAKEEFGDILFSLVNLARFIDINAEESLRLTSEKFRRRFAHVERRTRQTGRKLSEMTLQEMDAFWDEAKSQEK